MAKEARERQDEENRVQTELDKIIKDLQKYNSWKLQGRCLRDGGKMGGFFSKKCKTYLDQNNGHGLL